MVMLEGEALEQRARKLGVDMQGNERLMSSAGGAARAPDFELERRLLGG